MNQNAHWTAAQMVDHLYGIGRDDRHLDSCVECRQKVAAMGEARARREPGAWIPAEFFAAQHRQINRRIAESRNPRRIWLPTFATAAVLLLAILITRGEPRAAQSITAGNFNDSRLYTEMYQSIESEEPRALAPMHSLFEDRD